MSATSGPVTSMLSKEVGRDPQGTVAQAAFLNLNIGFLPSREMFRLLDGLRYVADEELCRFVLVDAKFDRVSAEWYQSTIAPLLEGRLQSGEFVGQLTSRRFGVVISSSSATRDGDV